MILIGCSNGETVSVIQSCPTLWEPMSPPGSSVHGILQERILEQVVILFSRGFSQPGNRTQVSYIAGGFFTVWATRKTQQRFHNLLKQRFQIWFSVGIRKKEGKKKLDWTSKGKSIIPVNKMKEHSRIKSHWYHFKPFLSSEISPKFV